MEGGGETSPWGTGRQKKIGGRARVKKGRVQQGNQKNKKKGKGGPKNASVTITGDRESSQNKKWGETKPGGGEKAPSTAYTKAPEPGEPERPAALKGYGEVIGKVQKGGEH